MGDPLGEACIVPDTLAGGVIVADVVRVRVPEDLVDKLAITYALNSEAVKKQLKDLTKGTTRPRVNLSHIREVRIPLPPREEQSRIVAEIEKQFTRLDAAVAALKRVQANLKLYRAAVLKAACEGRLVRTEAEIARREGRSYEPASVLLDRVLADRRSRWEVAQISKMRSARKAPKDDKRQAKHEQPAGHIISGLPRLPEGWIWASWAQIGFSQNGRAFPSNEYQDHGIKLLRPGNLHSGGRVSWTVENTRYLPERWGIEFPAFAVGGNELVMNLTAQSLKDEFLGRVCITETGERCLLNQRIARLSAVGVESKYLLWMFKSWIFRKFVDELNTGSLIQHMFTSQLEVFCVPLPPSQEQFRIVLEIERRISVIDELEDQVARNLRRIRQLGQTILKRAFEGKLVAQDPKDEPASVLLERIRTERDAKPATSSTTKWAQKVAPL